MKPFFLFFLLSILYHIGAKGQVMNNHWINYLSEFEIKESMGTKISGSAYRYKDFSKAEVFFKQNDSSLYFLMNYNAYNDAIEFEQDNRKYQVNNPQQIKKIIINDEVLVYRSFKDKAYSANGFLFELVGKNVCLYKQENIKLIPAKTAINSYDSSEPAKYVPVKAKYFYSVGEQPAVLIKNKKQLIEELQQYKELEKYLSKEKIKLNSEEDMIKLFNYLNQ